MRGLGITLFILGLALISTMPVLARTITYAEKLCQSRLFDCLTIKKGQSWENLFPDAHARDIVQTLNRINIALRPGMRIAVPSDASQLSRLDIAPFPAQREAEGRKVVIFDPKQLAWAAYGEDGRLVNWGAASGGNSWCSDVGRPCRTPAGTFSIQRKQGAGCISSQYPIDNPGAPMPYCMHFHRGFAIHASTTVPGVHASHGCVRVFERDAKWLNEEFTTLPDRTTKSTKVIIQPYA